MACSIHGGREIHMKCLVENLKERNHKGNLDIDGKVMLKQILKS